MSERDPYAQAQGYYTPSQRLDYVKVHWERPQFEAILTDSLYWLLQDGACPDPLRIVDVGAGAGEGFELIKQAIDHHAIKAKLHYYAIDMSRSMLETARRRLARYGQDRNNRFTFIESDARTFDFTAIEADIFMSVGAPYSHLTENELSHVLISIMSALKRRPKRSAILVDVLGRYSLEWLPLAGTRRRSYVMSFFSNVPSPPITQMTFYSKSDLGQLLDRALSTDMHERLADRCFWDRSIFVGRHTLTGLYNLRLPFLRTLINDIARTSQVSADTVYGLHIPPEAVTAGEALVPPTVFQELCRLTGKWNKVVLDSAASQSVDSLILRETLRSIDQQNVGDGLGLGHSLTMVLKFESA